MSRVIPHRVASKQRGLATILLVLLVGLALTVTALGVAHGVRGAQDKTLTMHAATRAQMRSWSGVELLRQYLRSENMASPPWSALPWAVPISGVDASTLSAQLVAVTGPDSAGSYVVTADITGAGAGATTTVRAIYNVTRPAVSSGNGNRGPAVDVADFYYDLDMSGGITIKGDNNANFNAMGNVKLDNASITGINAIHATGNAVIGSGIKVNQIYVNGNVTLTGSSAIQSVSALGNVVDNSSGTQGVINSNGNVTIGNGAVNSVNAMGAITASSGGSHGTLNTNATLSVSNGVVNTANAIGNVTLSGGTIKTTNTMGSVNWSSTGTGAIAINANGSVSYAAAGGAISALGDVSLTGGGAASVRTMGNTYVRGYGGIGLLQGKGNLQVDQYAAVTGTIGGALTKLQQWNTNVLVSLLAGFLPPNVTTVALTPIAALQPYALSRPVVDAFALKSAANYVFEYQPAGYTRVSVHDVAGIVSGSYALASDGARKDFLCPIASFNAGSRTCSLSGSTQKTICQGYSTQNACFTYASAGAGKWTIAGISLAPGAYWFDGDLEVSTGIYFNTFIATGHIATSGQHVTKSPNNAGYGPTCANAPSDGVAQTAFFAGLVPTNFCNGATAALTQDSLGNIAFLSGAFRDGVFSGGNIMLGASTKTYGTIVAGNLFNSGGSTTVYGYVAAAGQAALSGNNNALGGSTTLDLTALPSTYTPDVLPCTGNCAPATATSGDATVMWTRYL